MQPPRNQRVSKRNNKLNRKIRRWTIRFLGLGVLILCLYTAWDIFISKESNRASSNEQPTYTADIEQSSEQDDPAEAEKIIDDQVVIQDPIVESKVEPSEQISLAFVGDIMMGANVEKLLKNNGFDYPYLHISSILQESDIAAGNMENPITDRGEPADKSFVFRTSPEAVPGMVKSGFDIFNLANNHTLDYGLKGLQDTIRLLTEAGMYGVGAGMNQEEAYNPVVIDKQGVRVAYLGLTKVVPDISWKAGKNTPGLAETYNYTRPIQAIEAANKIADMVVVLVHWGIEGATEPKVSEKELAHRYIDAGADLVIGSHPHVLQGIESYKGKWIAYSLGNFIFTTNGKAGTNDTVIVQASCSKSGDCQLNIVPIIAGPAQPKRMEDTAAKLLYQYLTSISYAAKVQEDGRVRSLLSEAEQ
jgi:poly-gamma-glutamate capsule biosynthesis protein CapA/YwtB (metallophosphatase superfamily)